MAGVLLVAHALARCELVVISPGSATGESVTQLRESCMALARLQTTRGASLTLLLREPHLEQEQMDSMVRELVPLFAPGRLWLHEKCAGARSAATAHGLGLHLTSTADWRGERVEWSGALGASTHSMEEVSLAERSGLNRVFLSPVFQPSSKPLDTRDHLGQSYIVRAQQEHPALDIYALGGITPHAAAELAAAGIRGVAVLGGIFRDGVETTPEDVIVATSEYLDCVDIIPARSTQAP